MKDSAIKGTGNSRYLKSVKDFLVRYPTYADFASALTDGTLPIDLNGINADGFQQVGDSLGKATLLKDGTAALYGLGTDALPDDVLLLLANYIPSPYGLLIVHVSDSSGNGIGASLSVSPSIGEVSTLLVSGRGFYNILCEPGIYTLTPVVNPFVTVSTGAKQVTVKEGEPVVVDFSATKNEHGEYDYTESDEVVIPDWLTSVDLFAVGGGASGLWSDGGAVGGGGGYTATLKGLNLAGEKLTFEIGAGGEAGSSTKSKNPGGTTKISKSNGEVVLQANGGDTPNGGSGGGSSQGGGNYPASNMNGGSDGSDGAGSSNTTKGTGQGTTTRKFGEAGNTLYSGGGGGAYSSSKLGQGGSGGGGNGAYGTSGNPNATFYGGGGGGRSDGTYSSSTRSGSGYQGLVSLRW